MSLWVGTYTKNGGRGLHDLSLADDILTIGIPQVEIANASYGVWNSRNRLAYFVDEQDAGRVTAWRREDKGWEELSASGSGGGAPCYLGLSPAGDRLAVANYAEGTIGLLSLDSSSGAIVELADLARPLGRGVDPERQRGPHAHCTVFSEDGAWLFHVDLGLDRVLAYPVAGGRFGAPELAFAAPKASGPRHLVLHPDGRHALLICELSAELHLLRRQGPAFTAIASRPTSAPTSEGDNLGGHLAVIGDGSRVAVTNRGHDDLAVFRIGQASLDTDARIATQGASPRHFWSDGKIAVVANEQAGTVALLGLEDRRVRATAEVPGACFVFSIHD